MKGLPFTLPQARESTLMPACSALAPSYLLGWGSDHGLLLVGCQVGGPSGHLRQEPWDPRGRQPTAGAGPER
ncbi:unnamed protein product [Rangifer tarandus platyrhynchus]|uniref:Uncharacterized protein n=2 Tax=Rangifer tarandus platyrhynchus TaxID=3082113 RepID=A0ABN8Z1G5_RANTA|nr:unnamed protein product [Rangifer tarandus platyrhynchus]CAI9703502.1 unnamed protein product [Rangifer tarandus platyrhynchus]